MSKNKGVKIPKKRLEKTEAENNIKKQVVLQRKKQSEERVKLLYKGLMDGIGKAIDEMEKDENIGAPTFQEVNDVIFRAGHAYNKRAMEEQWKNVKIVRD